ncbi:flagellar hook-associated protein FlgK [Halobacillus litoralis]|uniref:flagellar hook-associated protein FlgK n=1 Tax=Halobacillus litoralis TaxID=45668 RepID=UPI001CD6755D|nr:flagellar hook-associated protein FlgK [Halobacillus litoralis]MCA0971567.1 flagellar hook-associated protein FlgK [Halobacillus litoralis]
MVSTFHGLEVAKRGLFTQQSALYTTGHNISNANTPGYTRQRVNFEQTSPFPPASRNRPEIPGQMGSGVQAQSIERVREEFLDLQYRNENTKTGYYESLSNSMRKMEEVMNEPSDQGLSKTMDRFWQSLQDLSTNPEDAGARSVVRQRGMAVAETFNYLSSSLTSIQKDLKNEINVTSQELNSYSQQLNNLNKQIAEVEPHGYVPNDLYDERDRLLDQMSEVVNIDVTYTSSGGAPSPIAMGKATVKLASNDGTPLDPPITLVDGVREEIETVSVSFGETMGQTVATQISFGEQKFTKGEFLSNGKLSALVTSIGYMNNEPSLPAYTVSEGIAVDTNNDAVLPSSLEGETLTITGTVSVEGDPGYEEGETFSVTINEDETLQTLSAKINAGGEGVTASVEVQDGVKRLVLASDYEGKESTLTIESSSSTSIGIEGEYQGANEVEGVYTDMLHDLDRMASAFIQEFNQVHTEGESLNTLGAPASDAPPAFFSYGNAYPGDGGMFLGVSATMGITDGVKNDIDNIAAANLVGGEALAGNGGNAQDLANVRDESLSLLGKEADITSFYEGVIGSMAVNSQEAERQEQNATTLKGSVEQQRQSVSAVSLDEEMTNMVKFQHAYNAAARNITVVDEMIDRIINQMGRVGR